MAINLKVNGTSRSMPAEPDTPLLYVLRNDLELNGAKFGCGLAQCGACTVLIDGKACARASPRRQLGNAEITTLEGLGTPDKPHALQRAFIDEQAAQCGYCISGMIMSAKELLDRKPRAEREPRSRRRWPAISAAAAPTTGSSAPCCAQRRRNGEDLTMNAPTLTRRRFTEGWAASWSRSRSSRRAAGAGGAGRGFPAACRITACSMPGCASMPTAPRPCSPARSSSARAS